MLICNQEEKSLEGLCVLLKAVGKDLEQVYNYLIFYIYICIYVMLQA